MKQGKTDKHGKPNGPLLRLLRFLKEHGKATVTALEGREDCRMLQVSAGKRILVAGSALDTARRDGLASGGDHHLSLTALGRAHLARADAGSGEAATAFGAQHRSLRKATIEIDGMRETVCVNDRESPMARLAGRRDANGAPWVGQAALEAGERLRRDFSIGGMMQKVTMNWNIGTGSSGRGAGGGAIEISDRAIDARRRLEQASRAIGPDLWGLLVDVCCYLKGLECVERERRWPPRSAKLMLRTGLDLLARHYGTEARGPDRTPTRHWGAADYRPEISG